MHQSKRNNKNNNVQTKIDLTSTWETVARLDKNFNGFAREINTRLDTINTRLDNIVVLITNKGPSAPPAPPISPNIANPNLITLGQLTKIRAENIPIPNGKKVDELTKKEAWELISNWEKNKEAKQ